MMEERTGLGYDSHFLAAIFHRMPPDSVINSGWTMYRAFSELAKKYPNYFSKDFIVTQEDQSSHNSYEENNSYTKLMFKDLEEAGIVTRFFSTSPTYKISKLTSGEFGKDKYLNYDYKTQQDIDDIANSLLEYIDRFKLDEKLKKFYEVSKFINDLSIDIEISTFFNSVISSTPDIFKRMILQSIEYKKLWEWAKEDQDIQGLIAGSALSIFEKPFNEFRCDRDYILSLFLVLMWELILEYSSEELDEKIPLVLGFLGRNLNSYNLNSMRIYMIYRHELQMKKESVINND